jgi:UDP-2,3-diacylglucosamine pyrophosphatase LpxH
MKDERAFIVSDLHLGSEFFHHEQFRSWLAQLPPRARLILNGDIIDDPPEPLPDLHQQVLEQLIAVSRQRPTVWVHGNHDDDLALPDTGDMEFVDRWSVGTRLLAVHGDNLDNVMPRHSTFKWVFRRLHRLLISLGAPRVHVAEYAKRWGLLYSILNRHVAHNAARAAQKLGFQAIACGHTHAAMDEVVHGVRYLNTGAWTETPLHYIALDAEQIRLEVFDGHVR